MKSILFMAAVLFSIHSLAAAVTYESEGKKYEGYVVNKGATAPLVLLIHDWDGLTDYEVKRADMLGKLGYSVFALDLFGQGVRPTEDKDKKQHTGELYTDRAKMRRLLDAAVTEAAKEKLNIKNMVVMGYCFGGGAALEMARAGTPAKGYVTFHGALETPKGENYSNFKGGNILVFHGSADTSITLDMFSNLAKELEAAHVPHEMTTYSGAPHAFTVYGGPNYRKDADEKSWTRFTEYLKVVTK
jgi:dienelactone hydrolase